MIHDPTGSVVKYLMTKCDAKHHTLLQQILLLLIAAETVGALAIKCLHLRSNGRNKYIIPIGQQELHFEWDAANGRAFDLDLI